MTLLVLVLSEIIPKTLGANYWRALTPSVTYSLRFLVISLKPFVWCAQKLTNLMGPKHDEAYYIRQEIEAMADIGTESGALHEDESEIIRNLLHFRHAKLSDLMTPRTVIFKVHKDLTVNQYLNEHGSSSFSAVAPKFHKLFSHQLISSKHLGPWVPRHPPVKPRIYNVIAPPP